MAKHGVLLCALFSYVIDIVIEISIWGAYTVIATELLTWDMGLPSY